jgi:hypothetical protein
MVKFNFTQSARDNIAEHYDLRRFEYATECLKFIDSLLADNKYLYQIADHVESGVRGPNPTQRGSNAENKWLVSTILPSRSSPVVYVHQSLLLGEYPP